MTSLLNAAKVVLSVLDTFEMKGNTIENLRAAIEEAEKQEPEHCMCPACINGNLHASDCAVHNAPALPIGECDCGLLNPAAPTVPEGMMLVKRSDLAAACGMAGWNAYDRRCYLLLEKMLAAAPKPEGSTETGGQVMTPCSQCKHWSLLQMISNGKPYSYYGDIPCIRCKHYTNDRDEFVPKNDPRVDSAKKWELLP